MRNFDRKKSTFFTVKIRFFTKKNNSQGIIFIPLGVVFGPRRGDYLASGAGGGVDFCSQFLASEG